ncbi:MAG: hypothetical protein ACP5JG_00840 [Anaerolineae bacterium]
MRKSNRSYVMLAVVALTVGVFTTALIWALEASPALAVPNALEATKSVDVSEAPPGGTVHYTIVLTNDTGSEIEQVVVSDMLDESIASADNLDAQFDPSGPLHSEMSDSGYVTFTVANLGDGGVATLTFDATLVPDVLPGTLITNTAVITDGTAEVSTNDAVFSVVPPPDLQIYAPYNGDLITQKEGTGLKVGGRVWTEFDPAPFPDPPVLQPISNLSGSGTYKLSWTAVLTDVGQYNIHESKDRETWAYIDSVSAPDNELFVTAPDVGTWYYRVIAYNSQALPSRFSNVEAVTVTNPSATLSNLSREPSDLSAFAVDLDVDVEVSINGSDWEQATVMINPDEIPVHLPSGLWATWAYTWTLPEADNVDYPISARASYAGSTSFYGEDIITVTLSNATTYLYMPIVFKRWPPIPFPPTLTATDPGETDDYRVSWTYNFPGVPVTLGYQLMESTDESFTDAQTYDVAGLSRDFIDKPDGTYYYRVRGQNSYGYGEWSNVVQVVVETYQNRVYNFTSSTEGWELARGDEDDLGQLPQPLERGGSLYHLVRGSADFSICSPMEEGPPAPYTLTTRVDIVDREDIGGDLYFAKTGMTWGIIFGGNDADPCPAWRDDPSGCLNHYYRVLITWDQAQGKFKWELKRIDYHEGDEGGGAGRGPALIDWEYVSGFSYNSTGWNEWKIVVNKEASNNIKVYMNGHLLGEATDHTYLSDDDVYFGTFGASPRELGGVATKWDWFKVER